MPLDAIAWQRTFWNHRPCQRHNESSVDQLYILPSLPYPFWELGVGGFSLQAELGDFKFDSRHFLGGPNGSLVCVCRVRDPVNMSELLYLWLDKVIR
jgi:hypothetical protein